MKLFRKILSGDTHKVASSAEKALLEVKELWKMGELKKALGKIDQIERDYPSCSKAAGFYRGKIGLELLQRDGDLPVQPPKNHP